MIVERIKVCLTCRVYIPIYTDIPYDDLECFCNKHHGHMLVNIPLREFNRANYKRFVPEHKKKIIEKKEVLETKALRTNTHM